MFKIGEFSKIAQVSGRQLRHYDQLGLLKPAHIDPESGYRYYTAKQLPRLNRILALKELGLTLEQIARYLNEEVSVDELRGMLELKRSQIEQTLQEEITRLRYIESRIEQIELDGHIGDCDVVIKHIPAQKILSVREICPQLVDGRQLVLEMQRVIPAQVGQHALGHMLGIIYSDTFEREDIDLEIGYLLVDTPSREQVLLPDGRYMTIHELPEVETMLTVTRLGIPENGHGAYSSLGIWAEEHGYRFSGEMREVFIQVPIPGQEEDTVTEIQVPIERLERRDLLLS